MASTFKRFLTKTPPEYDERQDLREFVKEQSEYISWLTQQLEYFLGLLDSRINGEE